MEKFILRSFLILNLTLLSSSLISCSPAAVSESIGIDKYQKVFGQITSTTSEEGPTVVSGTGGLLFTRGLPGITSSVSYSLRGKLDYDPSHITIISHTSGSISPTYNSGISIKIERDGIGIKVSTWVGNQIPVTISNGTLGSILYNDFDIIIDVHNTEDTYSILLWPKYYMVYSAATSLIASGTNLPEGLGNGIQFGLTMQNATFSKMLLDNAKTITF